jgi:hypothetical protein
MKDPISEGLNLLATGLRPYVTNRVQVVLRDQQLCHQIQFWDAQALMVFMWDRWNDLFRNELTFVERSLISELRDFRNRWAHQDWIEECDVYRILDDIQRLLTAVNSPEAKYVSRLRRESLNRLWLAELGDDEKHRRWRMLWPYVLCGCSALAMDSAIVSFGNAPWSWILSGLVFLAMIRVAFLQSTREAHRGPGPHECTHCGRIIYSVDCPYCSQLAPDRGIAPESESSIVALTGSSSGRWSPPEGNTNSNKSDKSAVVMSQRKL